MIPLLDVLDPEESSRQLRASQGSKLMNYAAAAYRTVAEGLHTAAAASDSSMAQSEIVWRGDASEKARQAFRNHANWLRTQGDAASATAAIATAIGEAYDTASKIMPTVEEVQFVKAQIAIASALSITDMGLSVGLQGFWEGVYIIEQGRAAFAMSTYAGATTYLVSQLPPPAEAPPIVAGPPGMPPPEAQPFVPGHDGIPIGKSGGGGTGNGSGPGVSNLAGPVSSQPGGGAGQPGGGGEPGSPGQPGGNPGGTPGQPGGGQGTPAGQTPPQLQQPAPNFPTLPGDANGFNGGEAVDPQYSSLPGTSPNSPTLAGLNGGVGSLVALGMTPGGFGAMPGSATGFRMPTNWSTLATKAFGMGTGTPAAQPVAQRTAPRGVTAPRGRERRRDRDERKPAKAFAPGEPQDVPTLEEPPAIGVLEYHDGDGQQGSASEEILTLGESIYDSDLDPIFESATLNRPR